jgi:hypothetical protein
MAVVVLATAYGLIADAEKLAGIVGLVTALVGNGLATLNTSTKPGNDEGPTP